MFINPKTAIEKGWIKFPAWMDENFRFKCVQPNAIDFTVDKVFEINDFDTFVISENEKQMRSTKELSPINGYWNLRCGPYELYDCLSDFYVELPEGVAAILVPRSTFARNGMFWVSGLYDSGFKGHVGGILHNRSGLAKIGTGTRIGQIAFIQSDSAGIYAGGWNHTIGTNAGHQL